MHGDAGMNNMDADSRIFLIILFLTSQHVDSPPLLPVPCSPFLVLDVRCLYDRPEYASRHQRAWPAT